MPDTAKDCEMCDGTGLITSCDIPCVFCEGTGAAPSQTTWPEIWLVRSAEGLIRSAIYSTEAAAAAAVDPYDEIQRYSAQAPPPSTNSGGEGK